MTWPRKVLRAADRRDLPLVAVLATALVADGLYRAEGEFGVAAVAAVGLATLPLLWRRTAPRLVLGLVYVGVFACLATLLPYDVIVAPVMVGAYSVAVTSDRRRSVLTGAFVGFMSVLGLLPYLGEGGATWRDGIFNAVLLLLAVVTGDAVRARRTVREATLARQADREREQSARALQLVAQERLRIAQDVHDVVAHSMVAISVQAGTAAHLFDRRPEQARLALGAIKEAADSALADLAGTLGLLRDDGAPAPLRPTEGLSGLPELAAALRAAGVDAEATIHGRDDHVPAAVGAAAFRIAQEASTNILRHAGARRARITVEVSGETVDVTVEDDGAGLAPVNGPLEPGSGNGIRGMAERAATLGGRLEAGRQEDGGWRVHAVLPIP